jgi:hypothetical protein
MGIASHSCDNKNSNAGVAQLVERNLAKVEVESSRLFSRSRIQKGSRNCFPFLMRRDGQVRVVCGSPALQCKSRRGSKEVMQRPAKPSRAVRFRFPPPNKKIAHLRVGYFFALFRPMPVAPANSPVTSIRARLCTASNDALMRLRSRCHRPEAPTSIRYDRR